MSSFRTPRSPTSSFRTPRSPTSSSRTQRSGDPESAFLIRPLSQPVDAGMIFTKFVIPGLPEGELGIQAFASTAERWIPGSIADGAGDGPGTTGVERALQRQRGWGTPLVRPAVGGIAGSRGAADRLPPSMAPAVRAACGVRGCSPATRSGSACGGPRMTGKPGVPADLDCDFSHARSLRGPGRMVDNPKHAPSSRVLRTRTKESDDE